MREFLYSVYQYQSSNLFLHKTLQRKSDMSDFEKYANGVRKRKINQTCLTLYPSLLLRF